MGTTACLIYIAASTAVVMFQLALAAGAPWGEFTMGGAYHGQLPTNMRSVAAGSAILLVVFSVIVAARAGVAFPRWHRAARRLIWVVVVYMAVGVVLNTVTPSARERMLWLPVALVLAVCALVVARSENDPNKVG